jgi:flagellar motor switch protein FliM
VSQVDQQHDHARVAPEDAGEISLARRRKPEIRTVDFSQPTKFTAELRRRIVRVLGPFCEAFALRLSTELRAPVELAVAESSQLTWSAAKAQLSAETIAVALGVQPIERQMLLCIEPPLVLQALECLLGGTAAQAPSERRLSEIDWALTRRLLHSMVAHLNPTWRDLGGLELELGEVDLEGDAGVIAPLGEPTFALAIESRIDGLPSSMSLLIPWSAIEPIAGEILGGGAPAEDADPHEGAAVQRGLAGAHVCLRAEVGAVQMPVEQMLALTPGALLMLAEPAEEGVRLFAEGVPIGRARPGLRGARRAIKLIEAIEPGVDAVMLNGIGSTTAPPRLSAVHEDATDRGAAGLAQAPKGEGAGADPSSADAAEEPVDADGSLATDERLQRMLGVPVRVWAELGRTTIPLGRALELPPGSVVELDQGAEAPIELFANGLRFAHGTLQVSGDGAWAVQIDALT